MKAKAERVRTEFMTDLSVHICNELVRLGIDQDEAENHAVKAAESFIEQWQGQLLYVPKNTRLANAQKRQKIRDEFTGNNHKELASKHCVNVRTVYKILRS